MKANALLLTLQGLEGQSLTAEVRADPARLALLLHPQFIEVGASGKTYTRDEVLGEFSTAPPSYTVWAQDFEAHELSTGVALLTYRSAHIDALGQLDRHVARTSLWQYSGSTWQLRFHQGTPTSPFEKHAT